MDETSNATPYAWSLPAYENEPRLRKHSLEKSRAADVVEIDIEQAVSLWGDTILRFALCRTGNISDAEDVTQMVFMKLCQNRPAIESDEHLKAWLLRVAFCCSIDVYRNPWKKNRAELDDAQETIERISIPRDEVPFCDSEQSRQETRVTEAVAVLPERQRIAIHLHYFEGYSTKEIALITGEKPSTVRSHLHRARATLKTMMGGINE